VAGWLVTAAGGLLVLLALRDIFHTLWHPSGRGALSPWLMRRVWRIGRAGRRTGGLVGPLGMVAVVLVWVLLVVAGWAMVYAPHVPTGFVLDTDLDVADRGGVVDALYLSLVTLATLGFGDVVPSSAWLRIVVPVQGLVGFTLITAAVAWVVQVQPALTRRRALAVRLTLLRRSGAEALIAAPDSRLAPVLLENLAGDLVQARVDVTQYTETYYFRDGDADAALPAMLGVALDLARAAQDSTSTDLRFAGALLSSAVADLVRILDANFLRRGGSVPELVAAYAADHGYGPD
jgi:Ion channel